MLMSTENLKSDFKLLTNNDLSKWPPVKPYLSSQEWEGQLCNVRFVRQHQGSMAIATMAQRGCATGNAPRAVINSRPLRRSIWAKKCATMNAGQRLRLRRLASRFVQVAPMKRNLLARDVGTRQHGAINFVSHAIAVSALSVVEPILLARGLNRSQRPNVFAAQNAVERRGAEARIPVRRSSNALLATIASRFRLELRAHRLRQQNLWSNR